jgi:toxin FitB
VSYLLDTNVLSEPLKPRPDEAVTRWFGTVSSDSLHVSVLCLGEIRCGVERLGAGKRRSRLLHWLDVELPEWFGERILPVDRRVADRWGRLLARHRQIDPVDAVLAATALIHGLSMVTRNVSDFAVDGLELVNPWA